MAEDYRKSIRTCQSKSSSVCQNYSIHKSKTEDMVLQSRSMKSKSFHLECENIRGEPLIVTCKSSTSLCCEIEVCRKSGKSTFLVSLSFLVVVGAAFVTWWISDVQYSPCQWIVVLCLPCLIILRIKYNHFDVVKESLTAVKNIGIQIKTTYKSGKQAVQFVDNKSVADIIINEAITMHKVIFYMAILTRNVENTKETLKLIPLFTSFYPRLEGLKPILHSIQGIIFNNHDQEEWPDHLLVGIKNPDKFS